MNPLKFLTLGLDQHKSKSDLIRFQGVLENAVSRDPRGGHGVVCFKPLAPSKALYQDAGEDTATIGLGKNGTPCWITCIQPRRTGEFGENRSSLSGSIHASSRWLSRMATAARFAEGCFITMVNRDRETMLTLSWSSWVFAIKECRSHWAGLDWEQAHLHLGGLSPKAPYIQPDHHGDPEALVHLIAGLDELLLGA